MKTLDNVHVIYTYKIWCSHISCKPETCKSEMDLYKNKSTL